MPMALMPYYLYLQSMVILQLQTHQANCLLVSLVPVGSLIMAL